MSLGCILPMHRTCGRLVRIQDVARAERRQPTTPQHWMAISPISVGELPRTHPSLGGSLAYVVPTVRAVLVRGPVVLWPRRELHRMVFSRSSWGRDHRRRLRRGPRRSAMRGPLDSDSPICEKGVSQIRGRTIKGGGGLRVAGCISDRRGSNMASSATSPPPLPTSPSPSPSFPSVRFSSARLSFPSLSCSHHLIYRIYLHVVSRPTSSAPRIISNPTSTPPLYYTSIPTQSVASA